MTREEHIYQLKQYLQGKSISMCPASSLYWKEHWEEVIKALEPEPKAGHWMGKGDFITCSCCNEMSYPFESSGYGSIYHNYCPNCGADMREVEE